KMEHIYLPAPPGAPVQAAGRIKYFNGEIHIDGYSNHYGTKSRFIETLMRAVRAFELVFSRYKGEDLPQMRTHYDVTELATWRDKMRKSGGATITGMSYSWVSLMPYMIRCMVRSYGPIPPIQQ